MLRRLAYSPTALYGRFALIALLTSLRCDPAAAVETPWWGYARGWFASLVAPKDATPVPSAFGIDATNLPRRAEDYRGRVVLMAFWASWCPNCHAELPQMAKLRSLADKDRLALVAMNVYDSREKMNAYVRRTALDMDFLYDHDGSVVNTFGISAVPAVLLVDPAGRIVRSWRQGVTAEEVRKQLVPLLAAAKPPQPKKG